jgi:hypothetical protein
VDSVKAGSGVADPDPHSIADQDPFFKGTVLPYTGLYFTEVSRK